MTHEVDGYTFTVVQSARFGPMKWYVGEIGLPNGGYEPGELRGFDLSLTRDTGWWGWTYGGCVRSVLRAIEHDRRRRQWNAEASAA